MPAGDIRERHTTGRGGGDRRHGCGPGLRDWPVRSRLHEIPRCPACRGVLASSPSVQSPDDHEDVVEGFLEDPGDVVSSGRVSLSWQRDPGSPAAHVRPTRRGVPAAQDPHHHAAVSLGGPSMTKMTHTNPRRPQIKVPEKRSRPKRTLIVQLSTLTAVFFAVFVAFFFEYIGRVKAQEAR